MCSTKNKGTPKEKENNTMTRTERNEYNYIRKSLRALELTHGCQLTIRTDAGSEYKRALDKLYTGLNFHPGAVKVDARCFDDKERIVYIFGRTWNCNGEERSWSELYTKEEKEQFAAALN